MAKHLFSGAPSHSLSVLLALLCLAVLTLAWDPEVKAPGGIYRGKEETAQNNEPYHSFRGIPFAEPPVGKLRFRRPVPKAKFEGVYDATDFKPHCLQFSIMPNNFSLGQEDCLYLNVFAPVGASSSEKPKKVYFYIHGGGNYNGMTSFYIPGTLVNTQDIIVVTPAYRLAFLGFLSTESPSCRGNFGLWDQVEALRWVKANIRAFGGDPDSITVAGESAGGIDSTALAMSSVAGEGLFHRVHPMSGVFTSSIVPMDPKSTAFQIARREKCLDADKADPQNEEEIEAMMDCLRDVPELNFISFDVVGPQPQLGLGVDGELIPKLPNDLLADPEYMKSIKFTEKSYVVGFDYNEASLFDIINDVILAGLPEEQKQGLTPTAMFYGSIQAYLLKEHGPLSPEVVVKIAEFYEANYEISPNGDLSADAIFHLPILEFMNATSRVFAPGESQVFLFRFVTFPEFLAGPYKGIVHGMEQGYLFDVDWDQAKQIIDYKIDPSKWNDDDDDTKAKFQSLIAGFAKTGKPSSLLDDDLPSKWPAYDPEGGQYLVFSLTPTVESHFRPERVRLWKEQIPAWVQKFPFTPPSQDPGESMANQKEEL